MRTQDRKKIMPRKFNQMDKIIVIDIEATCYEAGKFPHDEVQEIIEFGITLIDVKQRNIAFSTSILVKPMRSKISAYCENLTSLTTKILEASGVSFIDAIAMIQNQFSPKTCTWASYGNFDKSLIKEQCAREGIKCPFSANHFNIKNLFALKFGLNSEVGMKEALKIAGIPLEGRHHRGVDDSKNIAKILIKILWNEEKS